MKKLKQFFRSALYTRTLLPMALISGTIIGAGVFSLPYIFSKAGWVLSGGYLLAGAVVFYLVHIMYADIILRSGQQFKFVGYARYYLGDLAFWMSLLATVMGSLLTLTAYLVLANNFIKIIFPGLAMVINGEGIFWAAGSALILANIKRMARMELAITGGIIFITLFIFLFGVLGGLSRVAALPMAEWTLFFLPFGPILFSMSGRTAVPAVIEYYQKNRMDFSNFKQVIGWGTFLPVGMYFMFIIGIVGIATTVTSDSIEGIINLPFIFPEVVGVLGLLTLLSSYFVIGLSIDEILNMDLGMPRIVSRLITILLPLLMLYAGFNDFLKVITLAGGLFLSLEGIIVVSMWQRLEKLGVEQFLFIRRPLAKALPYFLIMIFFIGALYTAVY